MSNVTATCVKCQKHFLILEKEQSFLKEKDLPLPTKCPSCRQLRRLQLRGERALYKTICSECGKTIIVSYNPEKVTQQMLCREDYEKYFTQHDPIINEQLPSL